MQWYPNPFCLLLVLMFFSLLQNPLLSPYIFVVIFRSPAQRPLFLFKKRKKEFQYIVSHQRFIRDQQLRKDFWPRFSHIPKTLPHLLLQCHFFIRSLALSHLHLLSLYTKCNTWNHSHGNPPLSHWLSEENLLKLKTHVFTKVVVSFPTHLPDKIVLALRHSWPNPF